VVKASMGHVRDLPKRTLGLDVEKGYVASYEVMPAKKETVGDLKREAARADMVYLATDPDREGEAIAWHLQKALGLADARVRRVLFHEITEKAVKEAFRHVGPIDMDKVNAQQARRFLDRFVGYQLSPLLWKKVARNLSAGRVQSVAVRLIADREREIRAFVSEEYWEIDATLAPAGSPAEADRFAAAWPSGRGRSSRPRPRPRPAPSATRWPPRRSPSRRSSRPSGRTSPTRRSRPARSSSRPPSACGSRARRR
jgi:DNA topoisomerase-1